MSVFVLDSAIAPTAVALGSMHHDVVTGDGAVGMARKKALAVLAPLEAKRPGDGLRPKIGFSFNNQRRGLQ